MLFVVLAFSYAGGTLQVFNRTQGEEAIYFGDRNSNKVSLMVNVYWGDEFIQPMLDIFEEKTLFSVFPNPSNGNVELMLNFLQNKQKKVNVTFVIGVI